MQLEPIVRMMAREAALGLSDTDISLNHPEYTAEQVGKIRRGTTFQKAVQEMQVKIDEEMVGQLGLFPAMESRFDREIRAVDRIRERFGPDAIKRGIQMDPSEKKRIR